MLGAAQGLLGCVQAPVRLGRLLTLAL